MPGSIVLQFQRSEFRQPKESSAEGGKRHPEWRHMQAGHGLGNPPLPHEFQQWSGPLVQQTTGDLPTQSLGVRQ
jgi:hypothetical protein